MAVPKIEVTLEHHQIKKLFLYYAVIHIFRCYRDNDATKIIFTKDLFMAADCLNWVALTGEVHVTLSPR